jgi:hypothetical protein
MLGGLLAPLARLAAAVKPVRIAGVDIYPIRLPATRDEIEAGVNYQFTVVEIATDVGVKGIPSLAQRRRSCRQCGSWWWDRTCFW